MNQAVFLCVLLLAAAFTSPIPAEPLRIVAGPYLQYPAQTSMIVRWETNQAATSQAGRGKTAEHLEWTDGLGGVVYHEVVLEGLEPASDYFYRVRSDGAGGERAESETYTFQTAVPDDAPFSFVVLCDTQSNPDVVARLAGLAWAQRPHFTLLGGDLVSNGERKEHWLDHFFPNMHALNSRVALIPCLGNHEQDAHFYYDYFSLPEPEYYYRFAYGNGEFFVVDSERPLRRGTEQYEWLDKALGASRATWKIVCLHRPAYSSDEDDYGDSTKQRSFYGDLQLRFATELYEQHKVDIVWSGHIHSYERTYALRGGKPVLTDGVVYMITGGGGGELEKAAPWRSPFTAKVFSGHHYCLVNIQGPLLRIEAYDLEGKIFDWVELRKE